jgi:hypothetical protein
MTTSPFNEIEQEIIVLRAVWDMIDGMVNYEMFVKEHGTVDAQLMFNTMTHQRLFNVLLVDFLSAPSEAVFGLPSATGASQIDRTFLFYLQRICDNPTLNSDASSIRTPVTAFGDWLESECFIEKVWFPSIEVESDIRVKRIIFLKICGDIAKHNFARLSINVRRIENLLRNNDVEISDGQGFLILPEFYDWFHTNIFNYHATTIAEYLNDIRWGIFQYLQPEFSRSFERIEPEVYNYRYTYPDSCNNSLARTMYWDLMNQVRAKPWFPRFVTTKYLRMRY